MLNNPEITAEWYLVAFVDVLGQRHLLRELRGLPDSTDPEEVARFISIIKKTVGTVKALRDSFEGFFEGAQSEEPELSKLFPELKQLFEKAKGNKLKTHMFSDFVALYHSLRDDINKVPMISVHGALVAASATFLTMLAGGNPIRGGIDIGVGVQLVDGEVYGAALSRAYELESKIAQYPRIVLGTELVEYIQGHRIQTETDVFSKINKEIAETSLKLIAIDDDGIYFLDYLGDGFRKNIAGGLDKSVVKKAYAHIVAESNRLKAEKNSILAFRYTLLRNYFEDRLTSWI